MKPLVLLDVDGVINDLEALYRYQARDHEGYAVVLSHGFYLHIPDYMPELIQRLVEANEVWWCTTWRERANDELRKFLGIPELPVVTDGTERRVTDWKAWAAEPSVQEAVESGRKVAWIEDFGGYQPDWDFWPEVEFIDTVPTGSVLRPESIEHLVGS